MHISVIICTYNRYYNIVECLTCLENQILPNNLNWEINIVDNNSTDSTSAVINEYKKSSKLVINYIFEGTQGLSFARNTGLNSSKGQYLIFIDDDIRVTPNWLRSIYETFETQDCDAVGGRIHIDTNQSLPTWITPDLLGFLGHQDFGDHPHVMDGINESPFGGNMAIHRRVIDRIGGFKTNLGRKGEGFKKSELFKGEETEFFSRLATAGGTFFYHPDALVYHKILPHQLRKRFFLQIHNNAGIQQAVDDHQVHRRRIFGVPFFVIPQLLRAFFRYIFSSIFNGPDKSFRLLMNVYYFFGVIEGHTRKANVKIKAIN